MNLLTIPRVYLRLIETKTPLLVSATDHSRYFATAGLPHHVLAVASKAAHRTARDGKPHSPLQRRVEALGSQSRPAILLGLPLTQINVRGGYVAEFSRRCTRVARLDMRSTRVSSAAIIVPMLMSLVVWASAAAQQFDCVLTDTADQLSSENRSIVVVFDESAKTLKVQDGSQNYSFNNVSISNIAISGDVDSVSVGIDRSSLGIVWQQYAANKVVTELGHCRQTEAGR
jgi:hypothetical protein